MTGEMSQLYCIGHRTSVLEQVTKADIPVYNTNHTSYKEQEKQEIIDAKGHLMKSLQLNNKNHNDNNAKIESQ